MPAEAAAGGEGSRPTDAAGGEHGVVDPAGAAGHGEGVVTAEAAFGFGGEVVVSTGSSYRASEFVPFGRTLVAAMCWYWMERVLGGVMVEGMMVCRVVKLCCQLYPSRSILAFKLEFGSASRAPNFHKYLQI